MSKFVHLHAHSEYSLLDGQGSIKHIIQRVKELGQTAFGLTDHGSMFGVVDFTRECIKNDIKPIIGQEAYIMPFGLDRTMKGSDNREYHHLLLLAQTQEGYKNLIKISSEAYTTGYYYKPRADYQLLEQYKKGLITTSGCIASSIPQAFFDNDQALAHKLIQWYLDVFGENFYFELQHHVGIPELPPLNKWLIEQSRKYNVKLIATNDCHYPNPDDANTHDVLLCIQTGKQIATTDRMRFSDNEYYIKSEDEMRNWLLEYLSFDEVNLIVENTNSIAQSCDVDVDYDNKPHIPEIILSSGKSGIEFLRELAEKGLDKIYGSNWRDLADIVERLNMELDIIHRTNFTNYFLIINDICWFCQNNNIIWNTRGSAAGSLVFYAIGVSFVDPLSYNLDFNRFLSEYKISIPDCDLDFPYDRRHEVIQYIIGKYGIDRVCQVVTFGKMKARMTIKDVGRAMGLPQDYVEKIAKSIKNTPGKPITIDNSLDVDSEYFSQDFKDLYENDLLANELIDTARKLEGTIRNSGIHAAAVLISDVPLMERVPLMKSSKTAITDIICQWDYPTAESLGMLKVDCLGLSTLSIVLKACENINERYGTHLNYWNIPYDSPESYKLLGSGNIMGIFQVENPGLQRVLMAMKPTEFMQVSDAISLYRPGPIAYIPDYIMVMKGEKDATYKHPLLEKILSKTNSICVYQEQVIQLFIQLAGFSFTDADKARKSISKKVLKEVESYREKFVKGCYITNDIDEETANSIYDDIVPFAMYGFNLAHSVAYTRITLITAWLKSNYPTEYLAACLMVEGHDEAKRIKYLSDCKKNGITVLPPALGKSKITFSIEGNSIRFGYNNIKEVGESIAAKLVNCKTIFDLSGLLDKKQFEALASSGVLDEYYDRGQMLAAQDKVLQYINQIGYNIAWGQYSLAIPELELEETIIDIDKYEKQYLGTWLENHPLDIVSKSVMSSMPYRTLDVNESDDDFKVTLLAAVLEIEIKQISNGKMAFLKLSDYYGVCDAIIFTNTLSKMKRVPKAGEIVYIEGWVSNKKETPVVSINTVKYYEAK